MAGTPEAGEIVAAAAAAFPNPPASALQALKTQADRRGLQIRCEDERVSEREWRARIVLTTSAGHDMELPWSSVCLGLKRAKQAAAELALDFMKQQVYSRAQGAKGDASLHFDSHLHSIMELNKTVATLTAHHQEAYNLLYERYKLLDTELRAAKSLIEDLCQANTDTHISARPSCSACDTYASSSGV